MTLAEQQRLFWQQVTGHGALSAGSGAFAPTPHGNVQNRLRLYRSMYRTRVGEALRATYPVLETRLGELRFRRVALEYLEQYPSDDPRIEFVGRRLPWFLGDHADEILRGLAKLAHLEWARHAAPLMPDPPRTLTVADVQPARFASARVRLTPSLHLVETEVDQFRVIWCAGAVRFEREIASDESEALLRAMRGEDLACVCDTFGESDSPVERARAALGAWFARGWISDISYE